MDVAPGTGAGIVCVVSAQRTMPESIRAEALSYRHWLVAQASRLHLKNSRRDACATNAVAVGDIIETSGL